MTNINDPLEEAEETQDENTVEPEAGDVTADKQSGTLPANAKYILAGVGAVLVAGLIGLAVWYSFFRGGGGEPVAAPRGVSFDESGGKSEIPEGERTVSLTEDQLRAAGLKIVEVGETLEPIAANETTTGVVKANEYKATPVMTQIGGVVKSVNTELGGYVRRGQTLAVVSSNELAAAQAEFLSGKAELDEAQKRYRRALSLSEISEESRNELDRSTASLKATESMLSETKVNFERSKKLTSIGAISQRELEQAETAYQTAAANQREAGQRFERAKELLKINPARKNEIDSYLTMVRRKQSEVGSMREKLLVFGMSPGLVNGLVSPSRINADLPIVSPVSGTVTERTANPGEVVGRSAKLLTVTDLSTVWVIAQVYEKDIGKVRVGGGAGISSEAFPGRYFRGNISYVDPQLDEATRTAKVRIELPNPGEQFKLGMYVNVALSTIGGTEKTTPLIPEKAVQFLGDREVVFEATKDPLTFIIRPVELMEKSEGKYPVKNGIFVGDRIVTDGSFLLRAEWLKTNSAS